MSIKIYKVAFADNYSTEFKTPKDLDLAMLKAEIEKISSIEVKQINKLEERQKFPIDSLDDLYFSVDFDYMNFPFFYNRILIPKVKETITWENVNEKMRDFVNFAYGIDVKIPSIKFS